MALTKAQREHIYRKYDGHCAYCGAAIELKDINGKHDFNIHGVSIRARNRKTALKIYSRMKGDER